MIIFDRNICHNHQPDIKQTKQQEKCHDTNKPIKSVDKQTNSWIDRQTEGQDRQTRQTDK